MISVKLSTLILFHQYKYLIIIVIFILNPSSEMDNNIQECLVEATVQNNVLKASIYHDHMLYECSYAAPTNINVQNFATKLKGKIFTFTKKPQ